MPNSAFVYVIYISATPDTVWAALTDTRSMRQYWFGMRCESEWTVGFSWKLVSGDGTTLSDGEILEAEKMTRLRIRWHHQSKPELQAEGNSLCTLELEPQGRAVKLSITHTIDCNPSKMIEAASKSWPKIISNLKSLLETGTVVLEATNPGSLRMH